MTLNIAEMVDLDRGIVDRRIFWDRGLYDLELEKLFARSWLFVAHESQVQKPGDFVTTFMGEDAVIVARDARDAVHVLLNSCPHRGNRVCFADEGNTHAFTCNYHGWTFGLNGTLRGMPARELYMASPGFDKGAWGLKRARASSYKGLIFATFAEDAPPLESFLGDFRWYLDAVLDAEEGGTEFLPGTVKSIVGCNWKLPAENFIGDIYHALWTHLGGTAPVLGERGVFIDLENSYQANVNGHGWEFGQNIIGNIVTMGDRELVRYCKSRHDNVMARIGEARARMAGAVSSACIFPNFAFLPGYGAFRTFQPKGPHKTEIHAWTLVSKSVSEELKERWRKGVMRTFSPGGILEMDDGENWEGCTAMNAGAVTRKQKLCYGLRPTEPEDGTGFPGEVRRGQMADGNQLAFYRRWSEFLAADSWADIPLAAGTWV